MWKGFKNEKFKNLLSHLDLDDADRWLTRRTVCGKPVPSIVRRGTGDGTLLGWMWVSSLYFMHHYFHHYHEDFDDCNSSV